MSSTGEVETGRCELLLLVEVYQTGRRYEIESTLPTPSEMSRSGNGKQRDCWITRRYQNCASEKSGRSY